MFGLTTDVPPAVWFFPVSNPRSTGTMWSTWRTAQRPQLPGDIATVGALVARDPARIGGVYCQGFEGGRQPPHASPFVPTRGRLARHP